MTGWSDPPSPALSALLKQVADASQSKQLSTALRLIDRAYRVHGEERAHIYRPYAEILAEDHRDHAATLAMLERATRVETDEQLESYVVAAWMAAGDLDRAYERLTAAIARLALDPEGPLARVARTLLRKDSARSGGFIALTHDGDLYGWARMAGAWRVRIGTGRPSVPIPDTSGQWRVALRREDLMARIEATVDGKPVVGSLAHRPAASGMSAELSIGSQVATLAVSCEWSPAFRPVLSVESRGQTVQIPGTPVPDAARPRTQFELPRRLLPDDAPWHLSLTTPMGRRWSPDDSPLLWPRAARLHCRPQKTPSPTRIPRRAPCAILIPVYDGFDETLTCLAAVQRTRPAETRVIVIDDASPDPALSDALRRMAENQEIELICHPSNRGFAAAVNTGLEACPRHDVVLLNADTVVYADWLPRLQRTAYARASTGTVTPWSGDGSIVSYPATPTVGGSLSGEQLDALVAAECAGEAAELPVGVGFCLYLRHDCHAAVGRFAAEVFGRGYGEETDYCVRARLAGFRSVLAADVYVEHLGGRSFGASRPTLYMRAQRLVELRHPGYSRSVTNYLRRNPLRELRRRLDAARLQQSRSPRVLIVSLSLGGGVGRFVDARQHILTEAGATVVVLAPDGFDERHRMRLSSSALRLEDTVYDWRHEGAALLQLISDARFDRVELNHVLHIPFDLIDSLYELGIPVDMQLHDYVYLCPQVTMMGRHHRFCGEAPVTECVRCVRSQGSALGDGLGAVAWRRRSTPWLRRARHVYAPSTDTAERYQRYLPGLAVTVVPHEPIELRSRRPIPAPLEQRSRTRVALIGGIGDHKGYRVLLACAKEAAARNLPLEFVVIGYTHDDAALLRTERVFITGPYAESELLPLLQREAPQVLWMASVWPETWSYTLDAALATDLPIVAFDIGAVSRRLSQLKRGILLPLNTSVDSLCAALIPDHSGIGRASRVPTNQGLIMADVAANALNSTVQVLPLPAGIYLFSVEAGAVESTPHASGVSLPALHVGPGPGVAADGIEMMSRSGADRGWLVPQGDYLVMRLTAESTPILVTSVQDAAGNALSVRAERLDARFEAGDGAAAAAATSKTKSRTVKAPKLKTETIVGLPLQISAHIRNRGDMSFARTAWAGRVAPGLWVESFSIRPLEGLTPLEIEYKSLTASGFETPWISDDKLCGTQGMGVPLIGFAVRLKPGARAQAYEVEYTGAFASGALVGPLKNGVPCRSSVGNDPLEGLQIRIIPRRDAASGKPAGTQGSAAKKQAGRPAKPKQSAAVSTQTVTRPRGRPAKPATRTKAAPATSKRTPKKSPKRK